jgi:hypothetical protein
LPVPNGPQKRYAFGWLVPAIDLADVKPLPIIIVVGAVTAVFATLLQKRIQESRTPEAWEPVSLS